MRKLLISATAAALLTSAPLFAEKDGSNSIGFQGTGSITDGGATFGYSAFGTDAPGADFTGVGAGDQLFEHGWFYRLSGDAQEFPMGDPSGSSYAGNTAVIDWADVGARGIFAAQETSVVTETGAGAGHVTHTLLITNNSPADIVFTLFHFTDVDVAGSFSGNTADATSTPDFITIQSGGETVEYRAGGNTAYEVAPFGAGNPESNLEDGDVDNFANTGLPFPSGDFTGAFQWSDVLIPSGGDATFSVTLGANTSAPTPPGVVVTGFPPPLPVPTLSIYALIALFGLMVLLVRRKVTQ